jgi:molybdopterin/thiamine biosynthesis adenylyltransferase
MAPDFLTPEELERYARQIGPGVLTPEAQLRLKRSCVLVTRAGGMGGPAALCLTMAGVGRVIIAHGGALASPDLNRQVLGTEASIGRERAAQFREELAARNRFVRVEALDHEPDDDEALQLARQADVILAAPPTFEERLRLNRVALAAGKPLIDAAQWGMSGTLIVVQPGVTACLRCVYPQDPPWDDAFPVVGAISSAIGSLAALEAIKILSGIGRPLWGQMLVIDSFAGRTMQVRLHRAADCSECGSLAD